MPLQGRTDSALPVPSDQSAFKYIWEQNCTYRNKKGNKSKSTSVINSMADLDARAVGEESLRALRVVK